MTDGQTGRQTDDADAAYRTNSCQDIDNQIRQFDARVNAYTV